MTFKHQLVERREGMNNIKKFTFFMFFNIPDFV